jgi:ESCRT-II complex subunit VPS22
MKDQLVTFKSKLEEFAMKHKSDIRRDPVFRAQFHTMCANIGVDPLASNKVCRQHTCTSTDQCHHMLSIS